MCQSALMVFMGHFSTYGVWQKPCLLERGWWGDDMGVVMCSFHLNRSPKMSYGVLGCDVVMLQNHTLVIL